MPSKKIMSKLTLEFDLLSRMVDQPDEIPDLLAVGIEAGAFRDKLAQSIFTFILDHRQKFGTVPDARTLKTRFAFDSTGAPEPLGYYCAELVKRTVAVAIAEALPQLQAALKAQDVVAAQELLEDVTVKVRFETGREAQVHSVEATPPRVTAYDAMVSGTAPRGLPMPWDDFTDNTLGWQPEEFAVVVARTGIGKSWLSVMLANAVWVAGHKVLFVSMEMPPEDLHVRHDAYMAEVPHDLLRRGKLNPGQYARYKKTMDDISKRPGLDVVGYNMSAKLSQLHALIERLEPDYVLVDGGYLMVPTGDNPRMSRNERVEMLAQQFKMTSARYKIPLTVTLQFNRGQKSKSHEADVSNIYGSDAWAQAATSVIALLRTEEDADNNSMRVSWIKHRNGVQFASRIGWDLEDMKFDMQEFKLGASAIKPIKAPPAPAVTW